TPGGPLGRGRVARSARGLGLGALHGRGTPGQLGWVPVLRWRALWLAQPPGPGWAPRAGARARREPARLAPGPGGPHGRPAQPKRWGGAPSRAVPPPAAGGRRAAGVRPGWAPDPGPPRDPAAPGRR